MRKHIRNPRTCILGMMFCVMGMIMGLGWTATAITVHKENINKNYNKRVDN